MKLSFVIPAYNVSDYIAECLDSVIASDAEDYEIILIDDGSTDNTGSVCDRYAADFPELIKVYHQENVGLAGTRNNGIKYSSGEYIFFLDSDDYISAKGVKALIDTAEAFHLDVMQTSNQWLNEHTGESGKHILLTGTDVLLDHNGIRREILNSCKNDFLAFVWRFLYRRAFLIENNIFFEAVRFLEDAPFNMHVLGAAERFMVVDIPIVNYRIRDNSLLRRKYIRDYDLIFDHQRKMKISYFEKYFETDKAFYEDLAWQAVRRMLPVLLSNVYCNDIKNKYSLLKRIGNSEMMRESFNDYDINQFKSKSLDWWAVFFISKKLYLPAHLICKKVLYKR